MTKNHSREVIFDGDDILALYDHAQSDTIVISFSGYIKTGEPRPYYADGFLQKNNFSAIFVLAKKNNWYQTKELEALINVVRNISNLYKECITYGQSMGAYGALITAGTLSARAVVTAPQTTISTPSIRMVPAWMDALKLHGIIRDNAKEQIEKSKGVDIIYDPKSPIDRQHFEHIKEAKNVRSYILPYGTHYIPKCLSEMGLMAELVLGILKNKLPPYEFRKIIRPKRILSNTYIASITNSATKRKNSWVARLLLRTLEHSEEKNLPNKKAISLEAENLKGVISEKWGKPKDTPSTKHGSKMHTIQDEGKNNEITIPEKMKALVKIKGNNNIIRINEGSPSSRISIHITGNDNTIVIDRGHLMHDLKVVCGSYVPSHNTSLYIGKAFSIEPNGKFNLYNSGNSIRVGKNCMISSNVTIRCGESPHLIFDLETGEYLDISDGVVIGDHVWIGENAYLTKRACIASENIVAACSVVTKKFTENNCVIAGNPAKITKRNIQWIRNRTLLEAGSPFRESIDKFDSKFKKQAD